MPKWIGPYSVVRMIGKNAVEVTLPATLQRIHPVFHVSLVKKYVGTHSSLDSPLAPPVVLDLEGLPIFTVEAILKHRNSPPSREFLVKWTDYDSSHNSWVPESVMPPQHLASYLATLPVDVES